VINTETNIGGQNFKSPAGKLFFAQNIDQKFTGDVESIRMEFAKLYEHVWNVMPEGRYRALVLTNLETAGLFATKAFSHGDVGNGGGH
jgi:hypothetical protein